PILLAALPFLLPGAPPECRAGEKVALEIAKIFFEYNSTDNDLGVQAMLDGHDRRRGRGVQADHAKVTPGHARRRRLAGAPDRQSERQGDLPRRGTWSLQEVRADRAVLRGRRAHPHR